MAGLKEKAEELVRMADIINNTMVDAETGTLLAREGYCTDIAIQFYEVAETLRLILHDALPQRFHSIQCNLVNNLQHAKVKDIQQLTIIFEDYKNHSLIPIDSLSFYESNQQFLQEKTKKKKKSF